MYTYQKMLNDIVRMPPADTGISMQQGFPVVPDQR
jgi:hypothetical protein